MSGADKTPGGKTGTGAADKVVVIGLDAATPELVFERFRGRLKCLGGLMARGIRGRLQSVVPAITVPAWICSMTGKDPGQLGIYGFRDRRDHSYGSLDLTDSSAKGQNQAVWDIVGSAGREVILVAVPPSYPPLRVYGCCVGCHLTPHTGVDYTHPASLKAEIESAVGDYLVDVEGFRTTGDKTALVERIHHMTRQRFRLFRHLIATRPYQFAMMVEIGLDRMQHLAWGRWPILKEYYRLLDREVEQTLKLVTDDTAVMVFSDHGAQGLEGGFAVNEWLIKNGYLTLCSDVGPPRPLDPSMVDWKRTRVWGEGGYHGRLFINLKGREPDGIVEPNEYEPLRDELCGRLEAAADDKGRPLGTKVFRPERIYRKCRNIPPDLMAYFGNLAFRSVSTVGTGTVLHPADTPGLDGANHSEYGVFILAGPGVPRDETVRDFRIVDCGPTALHLLGYDTPEDAVGRTVLGRTAPGRTVLGRTAPGRAVPGDGRTDGSGPSA